MAAAEVLAPGSTAASSADIVVAAPTLLALKGSGTGVQPGERSQVIVELKDDLSAYWPVGQLNGVGPMSMLLEAAATYRVTRVAANTSGALVQDPAKYTCGVFTG
jgi:hypothetical protein